MTEILLYGEVGFDFDAAWLMSALDGADSDVTLRVYSPGGDVFEGIAISNAIRRARARGTSVTAVVDSLCASAASYMCLTADRILAGPGSVFMVHRPSGLCYGTAEDMLRTARSLDSCEGAIRQLYELKTGRSESEIDDAMRDETWMTARQAVEFGLADAIDEEKGPDLSLVNERWTGVRENRGLAALASTNPDLADSIGEWAERSDRFARTLLRARQFGNSAVDTAHTTIDDGDGDGSGEAPVAAEGEAPAYAIANGHIYRIGKHKE